MSLDPRGWRRYPARPVRQGANDDLIAYMQRLDLEVEVIDLDESLPHKAAGFYLRVLARKRV